MLDENFQVLKSESVSRLKRALMAKPELIELPFDQHCEELHLSFVSTGYAVDTSKALLMPMGMRQEENMDSENCKIILTVVPKLTPAQATDERLWVTLGFTQFSDYVKARWPFRVIGGEQQSAHIANHWFANGVRGRMRDNAISRLWWMGFTASNIPNMSMEQVFTILFANSDYRSSLLERNSSANSLNVLEAILRVSDTAYKAGVPYKRISFRKFMSKVDTLGGRSCLAALDVDALEKIFSPIYQECYAESEGSSDEVSDGVGIGAG